MSHLLTCPCGAHLKIPGNAAGKRTKCPRCGAVLEIPGFPDEFQLAKDSTESYRETPAADVPLPRRNYKAQAPNRNVKKKIKRNRKVGALDTGLIGSLRAVFDAVRAIGFIKLVVVGAVAATCAAFLLSRRGGQQVTLQGHSGIVLSVAFSPDGKTLASASYDRTVKLWDVEAAKPLATLTGFTLPLAVSFSPNASLLAVAEAKLVTLWDPATGQKRGSLRLALKRDQPNWQLVCIAFAPEWSAGNVMGCS